MTYEAVLFDMDGVLLSGRHTPRRFYDEATRTLLAEYGIEEPGAAFHDPDTATVWREACASRGLPAESLWTRREALVSDLENEYIGMGGREPYDDAAVLETLDLVTGIVSNNRQATVDCVVETFGFDVSIATGRRPTLEGYERLKPDPHYLEVSLDAIDIAPTDALYVGDRKTDVRAADTTGMDAALLHRDVDTSGTVDPSYRLDTLWELQSVLEPTRA